MGCTIIGFVGGVLNTLSHSATKKLKIDDPVGLSGVLTLSSIWSILAVGILEKDLGLLRVGTLEQLSIQFFGVFVVGVWSFFLSFVFFWQLKRNNRHRIETILEICGLDFVPKQANEGIDQQLLR